MCSITHNPTTRTRTYRVPGNHSARKCKDGLSIINMCKYKMAYISGIVHFSLLGERLFSRSRPRGTQGARVPTRLQFDLRRRSVPQALVAQSRAALTLCPGMGAAPSRPTRVLETRIYVFSVVFLFFSLLAANLLLYHTPSPSSSLLMVVTVQQQPRLKPVPM